MREGQEEGRFLDLPSSKVPVFEDSEWREFALCRERTDINFFPETRMEEKPARMLCKRCPVINHCLYFALISRQPCGIWGNTNESQRRKMRQRDWPQIEAKKMVEATVLFQHRSQARG